VNWTKKHTIAVIIILLLGLAIRLVPLLPPEMNLVRHVVDDAYYLFCEADNLVYGKGLSFDGVNLTTSGRPLYIVFLAGVDLLVGRGNLPGIAYLLGVIADFLTALLIVRLLRKLNLPPAAAILSMFFYFTSARIIFYGINGMETPFAILSIAVLLNLYQSEPRSRSSSVLHAVARGVTIALMMLLRLDYIFLVIPVAIYELWKDIRKHNWEWLWMGISAGAIMTPWVWWSMATNGSLLPPSADALTLAFAPKFSGGFSEIIDRVTIFLNASNGSLYLILYLFKFTVTAAIVPIVILLVYTIYRLEVDRKLKLPDWLIILLLTVTAILSFLVDAVRWLDYTLFTIVLLYLLVIMTKKHQELRRTLLAIAPIAIGFVASIIYYTTIRLYFRLWNTIEGGLFIAIILGAFCAVLLKRRFGAIYIAILVCWVMASNIIIAGISLDKGPNPSQERFFRAAVWVKENTPADTVIASANGGIIQWYGGRTVVDAAGIEDIEAYKALKNHELYAYLKQRGVQYLIDPEQWPFKYYAPFWGVNMHEKLEAVYDTDPLNQDKYKVPGTEIIKSIIYKLK
jgi:hypothetical protein